jgi:hypothetical protein
MSNEIKIEQGGRRGDLRGDARLIAPHLVSADHYL